MTSLATLGAGDLRAVMEGYRDALRLHQEDINRLNVYPVPDGDTGTNMALTLEAVMGELEGLNGAGIPEVCRAIGHGSLMGARGNSGVILSQLLRGMTERMGQGDDIGPELLVDAMAHASELARKAVVRPVEGTILTVAAAAAEGAADGGGSGLVDVVERARAKAAEALARTPELLPVLADAGVVDAGGAGFLLLLDAFLLVLDGRPLPQPSGVRTPILEALAGGRDVEADTDARERHASGDLRYEVMYLLSMPDDSIEDFKEVWAGIGDSIVVVGGDGLWNCHIHTNDIGAAIEAALERGQPRRIRVTDLEEQVEEERWVRESAGAPGAGPSLEGAGPPPTTTVVAVVTGDGIGRIFRSLGVHHLVVGGQTMNPATADLLKAVEAVGSDDVVILPNNKNIRPVAQQVDALSDKNVKVVATGSIVEGFAALLAYDPAATADANAVSMAESAARVVPAEITRAVRDAATDAGEVHAGDYIGICREGVVAVADSVVVCTRLLVARLLQESHELITLIEGEGARAADTRAIEEWLSEEYPDVALEVHHGGQPLYPYLLGIE